MDRISLLPEELLVQILSLVPTKAAVATSVLSKRWRSLWKMVPKLDFDYDTHEVRCWTSSEIIYRTLHLHKAPVLHTLRLTLDRTCAPEDVSIWIGIALDRGVRDLKIVPYFCCASNKLMRLQSKVYFSETLEALTLKFRVLVDVPPQAHFGSLKTLHLTSVGFEDDESLPKLLSSCPVLRTLVVQRGYDRVSNFAIASPSLCRLFASNGCGVNKSLVINSPRVKYLTIRDFCKYKLFQIEEMPEVVEANIAAKHLPVEKLLRSVTSAKNLTLRLLPPKVPYPTGCVFHRLQRLELHMRDTECLTRLMCFLEHCPKLRALKLQNPFDKCYEDPLSCWDQPSSVPECLSLHLETFEWKTYTGKRQEKEVVAYIMTNATPLKKASFIAKYTKEEKKHEILKGLTSVAKPEVQLHVRIFSAENYMRRNMVASVYCLVFCMRRNMVS